MLLLNRWWNSLARSNITSVDERTPGLPGTASTEVANGSILQCCIRTAGDPLETVSRRDHVLLTEDEVVAYIYCP